MVLDLSEMIAGMPRVELEALLDGGAALKKFRNMVEAQGGRVADLERLLEIHRAPVIREILATKSGEVLEVDAGKIGQASLELGAGRANSDDVVDYAVGFDRLVKRGSNVFQGEVIARIHARTERAAEVAAGAIMGAIVIS